MAPRESEQRPIPMCLGTVWPVVEGLLIARLGLVELTLLPQHEPQVVVGLGIVGLEDEGLPIARLGLVELGVGPTVALPRAISTLEAAGGLARAIRRKSRDFRDSATSPES
jgi:hypothetical protein